MDLQLLALRNARTAQGREVFLVSVILPGETDPILAVTNNPGDISHGGVTYTSYNLSVEPAPSGDDGLPTSSLRISNIMRALEPTLWANDWFRGATMRKIAYNTSAPDADYSDQTSEMEILFPRTDKQDVVFSCGVPQDLIEEIPEDSYGPFSCRHAKGGFGRCRCGYTPAAIEAIALSGTDPIAITQTGHGYSTGSIVRIAGTGGLTPALDDVYAVTVVDADHVTLDETDSSDYSGSWDSEGTAGFAYCGGTYAECIERGRKTRFGGQRACRDDALRIAV